MKKNYFNNKIIFVLILLLIASLLSLPASAAVCDFTGESIPEGDGFLWSASEKKLTLDNADISGDVILPADSKIELVGASVISGSVKSSGTVTVSGIGSITVNSSAAAFQCGALKYDGFNAFSDDGMTQKITVSNQNKVIIYPVLYSLNVTYDGEGSVVPTSKKYPAGAVVDFIATAADGYRFDSWTCSSSGAVFVKEGNTASMIMPAEDVTVHAKFAEGSMKYTVTVEITEPYSCTTTLANGKFSPNDMVSIGSSPRNGYAIEGWSSSDIIISSPISPTLKFIMPEKDVKVSISYKPITYKFKIESDENGEVSIPDKEPDGFGYYYFYVNEEVSIVASPNKNFLFGGWSATGSADIIDISSKETYLRCPASDFVLKAQFASALRNLTVTHGEGGSTIPSDVDVQYGVGCILDLTAVPDDGYVFSEWQCSSDKGEFKDIHSDKTTFIMPDADCTVTAIFKKGGYSLKIIAKSGGKVSPQISSHEMGEVVKISALPHAGYIFVRWECEDESLVTDPDSPETTVIMPAENVKITAVFELGTSIDSNIGGEQRKSFGYIPLIICFFFAALAIVLVILKEKYKFSYGYMFKKFMKKLFGDE